MTRGSTLTATATCTAGVATAMAGTPEKPRRNVPVNRRLLTERAGYLTALVHQGATDLLASLWSDERLDVLAAGVDAAGRKLPSKGWMALRRLGWTVSAAPGVRVPDRVARAAEEEVARALRLTLHRRAVVTAIVSTWPADPRRRTAEQWALLRARLPAGTDRATIRNRTRQVSAFTTEHGRLPSGFTELEAPPRIAGQVLLAAADRQLVRLERASASQARLWVQLPTTPAPVSYAAWVWHDITVALPPTVPDTALLCTPTLRVRGVNVRIDLPFQTPTLQAPLIGHRRAIGADWGYHTLLTGVIAEPGPDGTVVSYGRPLRFDAAAVSRKLDRLRRHREHLNTKISHLQKLAAGRGPGGLDPAAAAKLELLDIEHARACARIRHLGHAVAWAGARWLIDQAHAAGATVVYLEDLTTMEAPGSSRAWNRRLSGATRGTLAASVRHLGHKEQITVVTVPARGTSSGCPRCGRTLRHVKAPDNRKAGNPWALCECGHSTDRDFSAAQRITARGLAGQDHTTRNRAGEATIRSTVDVPVRRRPAPKPRPASPPRPCRDKDRPTPPRPRRKTPGRAPDFTPAAQATAGSRPAPSGAVQRPAGRTPQNPTVQVPGPTAHTFSSNQTRTRHRVRRAVLGRGFHRHVTSTPLLQRRGPHSEGTPGSHRTAQEDRDA
jgi:hypothetical protein